VACIATKSGASFPLWVISGRCSASRKAVYFRYYPKSGHDLYIRHQGSIQKGFAVSKIVLYVCDGCERKSETAVGWRALSWSDMHGAAGTTKDHYCPECTKKILACAQSLKPSTLAPSFDEDNSAGPGTA